MVINSKNILITGGAGYIGSHATALFGESGYNIIVYDNLSTGRRESVLNGELVEADLENLIKLENVFKTKNIDAVIHFAGSIVVPESVKDPLKYYSNNTINSLNLIKLCSKYSVNKFIFSSTAATYGMPQNGIATEETAQVPINPYGTSKLVTEWMLRDYSNANPDFRFIALRYFNVSGADPKARIGQCFPGATHLIKVSCEAATGKRDGIKIFGTDYDTPDGTCIRDYIHVSDLAEAHLAAYQYLCDNGKSDFLNCGYGKGYSVKEVINSVKEISKINFKIENTQRRAGDPPVLIADSNKIKKLLNWKPKYSDLNIIVKTALEWEKILSK